jgi:hypothetical protein
VEQERVAQDAAVQQGEDIESSLSSLTSGTVVTFEAESSSPKASATGFKVTTEAAASGGKYVEFNGTGTVGAWIEFSLTNVTAGTYDVAFLYKSNNNRGKVQAALDSVSQGSPCDEYAATAGYKVKCALGSKTLSAGTHKIRFTVTGKNTRSSGYQMTVDQIALTYRSVCTPGATQCSGNAVQTCNSSGAWGTAVQCAGQACSNGVCTGVCTPGATQCSGNAVQICNSSGAWSTAVQCASQACSNGVCTGVCTPGATQCSGNAVQTCNSSGAWGTAVQCAGQACVSGVCTGVCTPGATRCSGTGLQTCNASGAWGTTAACPAGRTCTNGACL